ncbi:MAG: thiamine pyrophosphate-binding protein [Lachnospiraceae bacterium]|nr:thiamine pyrophosphate-binding protein [Lachnospiraceae bacterium]
MKKRVADILVETLVELGVVDCFSVVGGGAMHLNNAFRLNDNISILYCHHEQACAFAAEGYAKYNGKMAAVCVTSGPGGMNTLNGVYSAWVDSTPMIIIAGHPRKDTTVPACGLDIRCRGVQEFDIVPAVKGMTKYATMLLEPNDVKYEVQKAVNIAMSGRRGPVWISVPLDVQAIQVEEDDLRNYIPEHSLTVSREVIQTIVDKLNSAERPCILTGSAIRFTGATEQFLRLLEKIDIPVVGGALLSDTLPEGYQNFYGLSGSIGPRAGNYILQNADLIFVLGNSLSTRQTGFAVEKFAPNASFIMVDAEKDEPFKPGLHVDMPIHAEINDFLRAFNDHVFDPIKAKSGWKSYCEEVYSTFKDYDDVPFEDGERVPAKLFWKKFRESMPDNITLALGNSNGVIGIYQYGVKKMNQRVITNYNAGSMGYDLPEAVGIAIASKQDVICVTGDGSVMMNLQELQTIKYNKLPIKLIVFSNKGYGAIRQTCKNFFNGVFAGCGPDSGVDIPSFEKIADTFDFKYYHCSTCGELDNSIQEFVNSTGNCILELEQKIDDPVTPKLMSKLREDGQFETPSLLDMFPCVDEEQDAKLRKFEDYIRKE